MANSTIKFAVYGRDTEGFRMWRSNDLNNLGMHITIWRREARDWGWSVQWGSGVEAPADACWSTSLKAMAHAINWWRAHEGKPIRTARIMRLGEYRRYLVNTSEATKQPGAKVI